MPLLPVSIDPGDPDHIPNHEIIHAAINDLDDTPMWLSAGELTPAGGSAALTGDGLDTYGRVPYYLFDSGTVEVVAGSKLLPATWATWKATAVTINPAVSSGDVVWLAGHNVVTVGSSLDGTAGSNVTASYASQMVVVEAIVLTGIARGTGLTTVILQRQATDGSDTLANDVGLLGIRFEKLT